MQEPEKTRGANGKMWPSRRLTADQMIERDSRIVQMREQGAGLREIAADLDCSRGTVHRVIKTARLRTTAQQHENETGHDVNWTLVPVGWVCAGYGNDGTACRMQDFGDGTRDE